jgi:hypothetical protein
MNTHPKTLPLSFVLQTYQGPLEPVHVCLTSCSWFLFLYRRFTFALSFNFDVSSKVGSVLLSVPRRTPSAVCALNSDASRTSPSLFRKSEVCCCPHCVGQGVIIRYKGQTGALCCYLCAFLLDACKSFGVVPAGLVPSQSSGDYRDHVLTTANDSLPYSLPWLQNTVYFHK